MTMDRKKGFEIRDSLQDLEDCVIEVKNLADKMVRKAGRGTVEEEIAAALHEIVYVWEENMVRVVDQANWEIDDALKYL